MSHTAIVKKEMRMRLDVIIFAAQDIAAASVRANFDPERYQKQMDEIVQYANLVRLDFDYLRNPMTK